MHLIVHSLVIWKTYVIILFRFSGSHAILSGPAGGVVGVLNLIILFKK